LDNIVALVSIVSSVVSIILAVFAILFSRRVENRLKHNFQKLKIIMDENQERTKEVLGNIDSEADAIKSTVYKSQAELRDTLKTIMDECDIGKK
jgi:RNase adaptor protein for sRNA GlmZ degradation